MSQVEINGTLVDISNPCALATELRKAEIVVAIGGGVAMTRFGEDEVRWSAANLGRLQDLIRKYEGECAKISGKRQRFAKSMRFV